MTVTGSDATGPAVRVAAMALTAYFIAFLVFAVLTERGFAADGSHYFLALLLRPPVYSPAAVYSPEVSRWAANLLTEWPMILAMRAGVTDHRALSWLFSFGLYYWSVAMMALSWWLLPRDRKPLFVLPLLTLVFGWMGMSYGVISQGQLAALWFWPTAFALAGVGPRAGVVVALILAIPTILMHEALCLYGPILVTLAWLRARRERRTVIRGLWALIGLWLVAATALALYFTLVPLKPSDRAGFITGLTRLYFIGQSPGRFNPPVIVALVSAALMLTCCWAEGWARRFRALWLPAYGVFLLVAALAPIVLPGWFAPQLQLDARSWVSGVPLLLVAALIAHHVGLLPIRPTVRPLLALIVGLAAAAQITWQVTATMRWHAFVAEFRRELASNHGYIPYETAFAPGTPIGPAARSILASHWTFIDFSIAIAPHGRVATIIGNPLPKGSDPFDPTRPAALPKFPGIDYSDYVKALPGTP
jgi:hypothetical protein